MTKRSDLVPARPKKRPYSPKERKKRFLLYCEGEVTEPRYFRNFAQLLRSQLIEIEIARERRKDPKRLVELAIERRAEADRDAKKARDDTLRYDEVWCVFDCDEHARLDEVMALAASNKLSLAFSNPCFELWLLLHFQDQYSFITTRKAHAAVEKHAPSYVKNMDFAKLAGRGSAAIARAEKMESAARENSNEFDNPTTSVWHLIVQLCNESGVSAVNI